jgi:hypothetical protein
MNKKVGSTKLLFLAPPPYIRPVYKSFLFDSSGNVNKIIVFHGTEDNTSNQFDPEKNKQYFSKEELDEIDKNTIPIIWSSLRIHQDDTIKTVKEKIFYEIEKDSTWQLTVPLSTSHLYLFAHSKENIDLVELYQELTQNEKKPLKKEVFVQILANLNVEYEDYETLDVNEFYDYDDFMKVFKSMTRVESKIAVPVGFRFTHPPRDYTFVANPYLIMDSSPDGDRYSAETSKNPLKFDENGVLLSYGDIIGYNLYCCLFDEVAEFSFQSNVGKEYMTELYFPLLSTSNIAVPPSMKNKTAVGVPNRWRTIDSYYDLYMKTVENPAFKVPYVSYGIQRMSFKLLSNSSATSSVPASSLKQVTLPLENIFKNIHASASIPYISFSPRLKKETILRLYSDKISKNGKKVPLLKENEIARISKELKRPKTISFYFTPPSASSNSALFQRKVGASRHGIFKEIEVCMELWESGEIHVRCSHSSVPLSTDEWDAILQTLLTPVLADLNKLLELFGYPLFEFEYLKDGQRVVIENIKYVEMVKVNKEVHLSTINGLSEIFTIIGNKEPATAGTVKTAKPIRTNNAGEVGKAGETADMNNIDDITRGVVMRFKRVSDFKENDEQTILITELFKKTRDTDVIINVLKESFEMEEIEAKTRLTKFITEHNYELDDIRDSAGFPTLFQLNKQVSVNNVLLITVDEVTSLNYLDILHVYINCILQVNLNASLNPGELFGKKGWIVQLNKSAKVVVVNQEMIEQAVKPSAENLPKKAMTTAIQFSEEDWLESDIEGEVQDTIEQLYETEENEEQYDINPLSLKENESIRFNKSILPTQQSTNIAPPPPPMVDASLIENNEPTIKFKSDITNPAGIVNQPAQNEEEQSSADTSESEEIIMMDEDSESVTEGERGEQEESKDSDFIMMEEDESGESEDENNENKEEDEKHANNENERIAGASSESEEEDEKHANNENERIAGASSESEDEIENPSPPSQKGGILTDANLDGRPISFLERLQSREPSLFLSKKQGKYDTYSRMCESNLKRQPVVLTDDEKKEIDKSHPNSYSQSIKYGTGDEKYWYICPRYWCLKTNTSITEEEVKSGVCGGIIPKDATKIPPGHYVYEFNSGTKQHLDANGKYINNVPGFLREDSHPEGKCVPCCFKGSWDKPQQVTRRQQCLQKTPSSPSVPYEEQSSTDINAQQQQQPTQGDKSNIHTLNKTAPLVPPPTAQKRGDIFYIISSLTYPIQPHRLGFLPVSVQKLFQTDVSKMALRSNPANIKPDTPCLLRYGVEYSNKQSFISCFAEIYAYKQELESPPTVAEMKRIMADTITIDNFIGYHNGSLVSVFKEKGQQQTPNTNNQVNINTGIEQSTGAGDKGIGVYKDMYVDLDLFTSLKNTQLWKVTFKENDEPKDSEIQEFLDGNTDGKNSFKLAFLKNIVLSYRNFIDYLKDPDIEIDHTFLWDAMTDSNPLLIKDGINLIIIQIPNDDLTDNVEIICPTVSASNKSYDFSNRETVILLKQDDFYEPIFLYEEKNKMIRLTKAFLENSPVKPVVETIQSIKSITKKYCSSQPSRPKIYHFKKNHEIKQTEQILKNNDYKIHLQLSNYQGKIIGLYVSHRANRKTILNDNTAVPAEGVYIPIYPSSPLPSIPTKFADADDVYNDIYKNYEITLLRLRNIQRNTNRMMRVEPKLKIVEDGLVVGILTETNQYVQLSNPETIENTVVIDGANPLDTITGSSHLIADKTLATSLEGDTERVATIRSVSLESKFYLMFRSVARITLGKYQSSNTYVRKLNMIVQDPSLLFKEKIASLTNILKDMLKQMVEFKEIDDKTVNEFEPLLKKSLEDENTTYFIGSSLNNSKQSKPETPAQPTQTQTQTYIIVPKFNLVTGFDNEILYYTKLADELLRHQRIRLFMFQPRYFSIIPNQRYSIEYNELLVLQSLLTHDYFKDIRVYNVAPQIRNTDYNFAEPAITEPYSNKVTREELMQIENGKGDLATNAQSNPCISAVRPVAGNWAREFMSNNKTKEIVFKNSVVCSYSPILHILQKKIQGGGEVTIDLVRKILWNGYTKYLEKYKAQILNVLKKEGKYDLVERISKGVVSFETVVHSEDYYMTNLDYWIVSIETNTPIILFNSTTLKNVEGDIDWLFLGGGDIHENIEYIRSPALIERNEPPRYSIIVPSFKYTAMKKMKDSIEGVVEGKPEFANNTVSLVEYLSKVSTKETTTVVAKKKKILISDKKGAV